MHGKSRKAVLTIAGSDPSGGAGIQADLKTFTVLGVYAGAAITCLTVQNTRGVLYYKPLAADLIKDQIMTVLEDIEVSHIKIGMVGSPEIAYALSEILAEFQGEIVYDPVLVASAGNALHQEDACHEIINQLLDKITVLTPNRTELENISNQACPDPTAALAAAASLFKRADRLQAVVVTGGHLEPQSSTVTDHLLYRSAPDGTIQIKSATRPRLATNNLHGTGCTFASAFTAYHYLSNNYEIAFEQTSRFMGDLIKISAQLSIGHGIGPLGHHLLALSSERHDRKA